MLTFIKEQITKFIINPVYTYIYNPLFNGNKSNIKKKGNTPLHKKNIAKKNINKENLEGNAPSQENLEGNVPSQENIQNLSPSELFALLSEIPSSRVSESISKFSQQPTTKKVILELDLEHSSFILNGENLIGITPKVLATFLLQNNEFETFFALENPFPSETKKQIVELLKNSKIVDQNHKIIHSIPFTDLKKWSVGFPQESLQNLQTAPIFHFLNDNSEKTSFVAFSLYAWNEIKSQAENSKEYFEIFTCMKNALNTWDEESSITQSQWVISHVSKHLLKNIQNSFATLSESDQEEGIKNYRLIYQLFDAQPRGEPSPSDIHNPFYLEVFKTKLDYELKFGIKMQVEDTKLLSPLGIERLQYAKDIYNKHTINSEILSPIGKARQDYSQSQINENVTLMNKHGIGLGAVIKNKMKYHDPHLFAKDLFEKYTTLWKEKPLQDKQPLQDMVNVAQEVAQQIVD